MQYSVYKNICMTSIYTFKQELDDIKNVLLSNTTLPTVLIDIIVDQYLNQKLPCQFCSTINYPSGALYLFGVDKILTFFCTNCRGNYYRGIN
jgi:hypothetical protein